VILDDPLSAVDAYVGKYNLDHCLLDGPLANRTRILVTHSLHILDKVDYIYVMDNGAIIEQGTYSVRVGCVNERSFFFTYKYQSLTSDGLVFSRLMDEFGNAESRKDNRKDRIAGLAKNGIEPLQYKPDSAEDVLMQLEERNVGAVTWDVYKKYLRFAGGLGSGHFGFVNSYTSESRLSRISLILKCSR
jgi:ATP-binding cassette subfamily C (CFTR/MRP) protein 1